MNRNKTRESAIQTQRHRFEPVQIDNKDKISEQRRYQRIRRDRSYSEGDESPDRTYLGRLFGEETGTAIQGTRDLEEIDTESDEEEPNLIEERRPLAALLLSPKNQGVSLLMEAILLRFTGLPPSSPLPLPRRLPQPPTWPSSAFSSAGG